MQGLPEILILVLVLAVFAGVFFFSGRSRARQSGGCCVGAKEAAADGSAQPREPDSASAVR